MAAGVLSSVLAGTPLPGLGRPVRLADIRFAADADGAVRVLDGELARRVADRLTVGVRLVPAEALEPAAGELAGALRLGAEAVGDAVEVTVETCVRRDPSEDVRPIEAVSVTFVERDGQWVVAGDPRHLAT